MRKLLHITCLLLLTVTCWGIEHQYVSSSILSSGHWIKIRIEESGIYALSYDTLQAWGLQPEKVRIYGYGGAVLSQNFELKKIDDLPAVGFYTYKGSDNVFGKGDYLLFYAQGTKAWSYEKSYSRYTHTNNTYSSYGYYFLSDDAGEQKSLICNSLSDASAPTQVKTYDYRALHERDSINLMDATGGVDGGGREWYGEVMGSGHETLKITFDTKNLVATEPLTYSVDLAGKSSKENVFTLSSGKDRQTITTVAIAATDFYTKATTNKTNLKTSVQEGDKQTLTIQYDVPNSSSHGYLNYVELFATANLTLNANAIDFRTKQQYGNANTLCYHINGAGPETQVWDITNLADIQAVNTRYENGEILFVGSNQDAVHEYIAFNPSATSWKMPRRVGEVKNQNLHALKNIDYVIITPEAFRSASLRLAQEHEKRDKITYAVVSDQEVYNEFSSGTPDASAYRWIMKMLYDRAQNTIEAPKWLLLMGDGTFDNRKLLLTSGPAMLLTYQAENSTVETKAYATDDYFGFMRNQDGLSDASGRMQIGVGRLPVANETEANNVVDKLIRYMANDKYGTWKQQLLFLADDGDHGMHTETAEAGAERVRTKNPDFVVNKVYLDAYPQESSATGESYPLAKNRVDNLLSNGVLYMNYSGHGGYNNITNEGMMSIRDVQKMNNANQAFWMLATCSFAHFDSGKRSTAEEAVLNPNGAAIGVLSADRTVYATQNTALNRNFCDTLFSHKDPHSYNMTLGDACRLAKNATGTDANKLAYVLLADPALKLNFPTELQVKTSTQLDTVNALTVHDVNGYMADAEKDTAAWFNGKLFFTIYDKMQIITTRDNDEKDPSKQKTLSYKDYPNTIFSGEVNVEDGKFHYQFMTPKDIRYNYGNGRIIYYAYDRVNQAEGVGHYEDFIVGGSPNILLVDTVGPEVDIYLNNPAFTEGMQTYETPRFYADIEDKNGINTVGSGIGHDMLLIIDEDPKQTYILNTYFHAENNSYQKGQVSYLLPELAEGHHTLTFRAWDLLNNSTTKSLGFNVIHGLDPTIFSISAYPNPVEEMGLVHVSVQYDQPDQLMNMNLYVYNAQGQMVYEHKQKDVTDMNLNIAQLGLSAGVYVYRIELQSATSGAAARAGKFIVTK